jgi:Cu/Ag efflux protein CusF
MSRKSLAVVLAGLALTASAAFAQAQPPSSVSQASVVTETAVIQAIDSANRIITLKAEDGTLETVVAGPEVVRFNELKVGDKVIFKYYESVVYAIQQPGAKPPAREASAIVRGAGPKPGGTLSQQVTTVVTIKAIDLAIPSVTITTADGNTMSIKVEDKSNLTGVKVGDKVQITYTQALALSVESPKK